MSPESNAVPERGPLPTPTGPAEAREYLKSSAFPAPDVQTVTMTGTEFTSVCPKTGQPDFATIYVRYVHALGS